MSQYRASAAYSGYQPDYTSPIRPLQPSASGSRGYNSSGAEGGSQQGAFYKNPFGGNAANGGSVGGFERGDGGYLAHNKPSVTNGSHAMLADYRSAGVAAAGPPYTVAAPHANHNNETVVNLSSSPPHHRPPTMRDDSNEPPPTEGEASPHGDAYYNNRGGHIPSSHTPFNNAAAEAERRLQSVMAGMGAPTPLQFRNGGNTTGGGSGANDGGYQQYMSPPTHGGNGAMQPTNSSYGGGYGNHHDGPPSRETSPPSSNAPASDDEGETFSAALVRHAARELGVDYIPSTGVLPRYKNVNPSDPRSIIDTSVAGRKARQQSQQATRRILQAHTDVVFDDADADDATFYGGGGNGDPMTTADPPLSDDPWMGEHFRINMSPDFRFLGGSSGSNSNPYVNPIELERQIELRSRALGPTHLSVAALRLQLAEHYFMCANSKAYAKRTSHTIAAAAAAQGGLSSTAVLVASAMEASGGSSPMMGGRSSGTTASKAISAAIENAEKEFNTVIKIFTERFGGPLAAELVPLYSKVGTFYMACRHYDKAAEVFEKAKQCAVRCAEEVKEREEYRMVFNANPTGGDRLAQQQQREQHEATATTNDGGCDPSSPSHYHNDPTTMMNTSASDMPRKSYAVPKATATQMANNKLRSLIGQLRVSDPSILPISGDGKGGGGGDGESGGDNHDGGYSGPSIGSVGARFNSPHMAHPANHKPTPTEMVAKALIGTAVASLGGGGGGTATASRTSSYAVPPVGGNGGTDASHPYSHQNGGRTLSVSSNVVMPHQHNNNTGTGNNSFADGGGGHDPTMATNDTNTSRYPPLAPKDRELLSRPSTMHTAANLSNLLTSVTTIQQHKNEFIVATSDLSAVLTGDGSSSGGGANAASSSAAANVSMARIRRGSTGPSDIVTSTEAVLERAMATANRLREQRLKEEQARAAGIAAATAKANQDRELGSLFGGSGGGSRGGGSVSSPTDAGNSNNNRAPSPVRVRFQFPTATTAANGGNTNSTANSLNVSGIAPANGNGNSERLTTHVEEVITNLGRAGLVPAHHQQQQPQYNHPHASPSPPPQGGADDDLQAPSYAYDLDSDNRVGYTAAADDDGKNHANATNTANHQQLFQASASPLNGGTSLPPHHATSNASPSEEGAGSMAPSPLYHSNSGSGIIGKQQNAAPLPLSRLAAGRTDSGAVDITVSASVASTNSHVGGTRSGQPTPTNAGGLGGGGGGSSNSGDHSHRMVGLPPQAPSSSANAYLTANYDYHTNNATHGNGNGGGGGGLSSGGGSSRGDYDDGPTSFTDGPDSPVVLEVAAQLLLSRGVGVGGSANGLNSSTSAAAAAIDARRQRYLQHQQQASGGIGHVPLSVEGSAPSTPPAGTRSRRSTPLRQRSPVRATTTNHPEQGYGANTNRSAGSPAAAMEEDSVMLEIASMLLKQQQQQMSSAQASPHDVGGAATSTGGHQNNNDDDGGEMYY